MRSVFIIVFTAVLQFAATSASLRGDVIISEIMYNPSSKESFNPDENLVEWIEIYNLGNSPLDITGWFLQDEDRHTKSLPRNSTIRAGQAIVLVPGGLKPEIFKKAWGADIVVCALEGWGKVGLHALANSPSEKNEQLTLRNANANVIDAANYDDEGDWPKDSPQGVSICVKPTGLNAKANDNGKNWSRSELGNLGGKQSKEAGPFGSKDVGSPGVVVVN